MNDLERRRAIHDLGLRAVQYYVDTGLCVFCDADDCTDTPHEEHCNVGELSGVVLDEQRAMQKAVERGAVAAYLKDIEGGGDDHE